MKKLLSVFILFIAGYALAETAWIRGDSVSWVRPSTIVTDAGMILHEPDDVLLAAAGYTAVEVPDCSPANRVVTFDPPGIRCKTAAELAAAAQAAQAQSAQEQAARIVQLAQAYGPMVSRLQANMVLCGISIPVSPQDVMAALLAQDAAGTLTEEKERAMSKVFMIHSALLAAGLSNADIAAIWEAIKP